MEKNGRRSGISTFFSFLFIPLSLIYYEILLKLLTGQHFLLPNICAMVLTSVAAGSIFYLIFTLFRSNKVNRWLALLFLEIAALLFLAEGAGGIANEFGSAVWAVILKGYWIILLYEVPVILFILFFFIFHILHLDQAKRRTRWILLLVFLVFEASGILLMLRNDNYARRLTRNYNFNLVTQSFSLQTAYKTDAIYLAFGNPFRSSFYSGYQYLDDSSSDGITYGMQELDLTFPETTNKKIKKMNDYVSSLTPSSRNEYTGMFKNGMKHGRVNELSGNRVIRESVYENDVLVYMKEYYPNGTLAYYGSVIDGVKNGMGCEFAESFEKNFEGIFKNGIGEKPMKVILKKLDKIPPCEALKGSEYDKYRIMPETAVDMEISVEGAKGIYTGRLKDDVPEGNGTVLYSDHRYTGEFFNGKPKGRGIIYMSDGSEKKGIFSTEKFQNSTEIKFSEIKYYYKEVR